MKTKFYFFMTCLLSLASVHAAIYGVDDRVNPDDLRYKDIFSMTEAMGLIISSKNLVSTAEPGKFNLLGKAPLGPLCSSVPFQEESSGGTCSSFLVDEETMITANYCVQDIQCKELYIAFDFQKNFVTEKDSLISGTTVNHCKSIQRAVGIDGKLAVITLEQKMPGRRPLKINTARDLKVGTAVFLLSYPEGKSLKISGNAQVREQVGKMYRADLDAFRGSGGGPVINQNTGLVEGVLFSGEQDYSFNHALSCMDLKYYSSSGVEGEKFYPIEL